ncbi:hypothetical protein GCM10028864_60150 [Microlunatus parietis]
MVRKGVAGRIGPGAGRSAVERVDGQGLVLAQVTQIGNGTGLAIDSTAYGQWLHCRFVTPPPAWTGTNRTGNAGSEAARVEGSGRRRPADAACRRANLQQAQLAAQPPFTLPDPAEWVRDA